MSNRDRDVSMDRLLREAMAGEVRTASGCLDAETLAAWSEGALRDAERASAEAHASRCTRCQTALAAMARTMPPATPVPSPMRRWMMMLVPAMAAAAAVSLWFAVDRGTGDRAPLEESQVVARKPDVVLPPTAELSRADAATRAEAEASTDKEVSKDRDTVVLGSRLDALKKVPAYPERQFERKANERDAANSFSVPVDAPKTTSNAAGREGVAGTLPPVAPAATPAPLPPVAPVGQVDGYLARERVSVTSSSPPPAPQQAAQTPGQQASQQPGQQAQQAKPNTNELRDLELRVREQQQAAAAAQNAPLIPAEPVPPATPAPGAAGRGGATAESVADSKVSTRAAVTLRQEASTTIEVASPVPTTRWRVVEGRTVERSVDAGATWRLQHRVDQPMLIVAGSSPSPTVCWLVGRTGLVLRTRDGRTWQPVKFPATVDLRAVSAADASVASVVTADGRTFTTANGGQTWSLQR